LLLTYVLVIPHFLVMSTTQKSMSPRDVTDEQWQFLLPYLTLMKEDAPPREYSWRSLFNAICDVVRTGVQWHFLPNDFPPWRWCTSGVSASPPLAAGGRFEAVAHDLRIVERLLKERDKDPSVVIRDARTLPPTPESGPRAGYDGTQRKNGSKIHVAVDSLGNRLAVT
jgi:transposase